MRPVVALLGKTMDTQTSNATQSTTQQVKPDFGAGRYSALMESSYNDAMAIFGLESAQAEKLARQIGSDFGAAMRSAIADCKVGKSISKDGKVTLSDAAKVKGVTATNALVAMRALDFASQSGKFGFSWRATKWETAGTLKEYLESL